MATIESAFYRYQKYFPLLIFVFFLGGMENLYGRYFPNFLGNIGHDFSQAHPALLDGALWFWNNNLFDVPWFTAAFCGGQPSFADPQGIYYSPLQWWAFLFPPTKAAHVDLLFSCSLGYWAFYFLARRVFLFSIRSSVLAGVLAMSNSFLPERFLVGEMGYQLFLLVGFIAHALLSKESWRPFAPISAGNVFWAGLAIAMMMQGGLTTLMVPAGFGVLSLAAIAFMAGRGVAFRTFCLRGLSAMVFAISLCAAKIAAGVSFMSHFPRDAYSLPGFAHIYEALAFPVLSLFFSSSTMWSWTNEKLTNQQWSVLPHEWAYQFGLVYLILLILAAALAVSMRKISAPAFSKYKILAFLMLLLIFLIPSSLLWFSPDWNAILKSVPLIKTTSFPFRWIVIFIPAGCWLGAIAWESIEKYIVEDNVRTMGIVLFCVAILVETSLRDFSYYVYPDMQFYNPKWVDNAWELAGYGKNNIPIEELSDDPSLPGDQGRNDAMVLGKSFVHCYNPAYGYRLETFPLGRIHSGGVFSEIDGFFNIKNPACLIWPKENSCAIVGEEYSVSDRATVEFFVSRKPIQFFVSPIQNLANKATIVALCIGFLLFFAACVEFLLSCRDRIILKR